jgi:hypothetical protein
LVKTYHVDCIRDDLNDEGVLESCPGKVRCTVIENEVDLATISLESCSPNIAYARKLLQGLQKTPSHQSLAYGALEAVRIAAFADTHLVIMVSTDLSEFFNQRGVVDRKPSESRQSHSGLFVVAFLDTETRRFGQEEHATNEDDGP